MSIKANILIAGSLIVSGLMLGGPAVHASEDVDSLKVELDRLRQQMQQAQQAYKGQIGKLESRIKSLESDPKHKKGQASAYSLESGEQSGFEIGLSGEIIAGGSSVEDAELLNLQAGGGHDPVRNGFNVPNVELHVGGTVDPYLDAQATLVFAIDQEGETVVELEEAFATTRNLPNGLQAKAGQYFTEFGRHNTQHVHSWQFVDQPVILSRLFGGDGLRSQGARAAWLTPMPWYSEVIFGAQNARGETVPSFLGEAGEDVGGFTLLDRESRNLSDLLYSTRWLNGFDLTEETSANFGLSALHGPNATGSDTDTQIYGADLYVKWQPVKNQRGFPFVSWQTEALLRDYEAGDQGTDGATNLEDWGIYTQTVWGFRTDWTAGLRLSFSEGDGLSGADPFRDRRYRASPALTWFPTEFSKLRLQYNADSAEFLAEDDTAHTVWLQLEYNLGSHFAHTF